MENTFFEATPQQKQLADIGRAMMDYSENYGKVNGLGHLKDDGLRVLNELSHVGYMLTTFGATFGASEVSFSDADKALIVKFLKKELDIS